jgi:hypothetical protein
MVGISTPMLDIYKKIELVANSEATVLITGESGTGKELVADAIIKRSRRGNREVVKLNCAAIPEALLESELFGHTRGSFTGATANRRGKILLADGGTLFLDEIGEMPVAMQSKLLRVIQQKEVDVVGADRPVPVDVRILAATSRNLEQMIREGSFREDLFYRLNVFRIDIPPLRERRSDIELIATEYLKKLAEREGWNTAGSPMRRSPHLRAQAGGQHPRATEYPGAGFPDCRQGVHRALPPQHFRGGRRRSGGRRRRCALHHFFRRMTDTFLEVEGGIYKNVVGEVERKLIEWASRRRAATVRRRPGSWGQPQHAQFQNEKPVISEKSPAGGPAFFYSLPVKGG